MVVVMVSRTRHDTLGLRVVHGAMALICLTRAIAYSDLLQPPHDSPGPLFLSGGGAYLWAYALLWMVVGVLGVVDTIRARLGWGVPAFIGITTVWGLSYLGAWSAAGFDTISWLTGILYLGLASIGLGAHLVISQQQDELTDLIERLGRRTGQHGMIDPSAPVERGGDDTR